MASIDSAGKASSDVEISERGSRRESRSVRIALAELAAVEIVVGVLWFSFVYWPSRYPSTLTNGDTRTALAILGVVTAIIAVQFLLEAERLTERLRLGHRRAGSSLTVGERVWCHVAGYAAVAYVVGAVVVLLLFVGRASPWSYVAEVLVIIVGCVGAIVVAALPRGRST